MPLFHHDHKGENPEQEPAEEAADVPEGMVRSLYPEGGLEPDLIGDEWKQGSPDEAVPSPTSSSGISPRHPARCSAAGARSTRPRSSRCPR